MSTYTDSLGLEEITPGDQAGLWGNTTNNNLALIDQAVTGVTPISFASLSGSTYTLTDYNGAIDEARSAVLNITGNASGSNTVVVPNKQKTYLVRNNTGRNVVFQTASPSATYTVEAGNSILIFCDGNNNVFTGIAAPSVGTLSVSAGGTGSTGFGAGGFIKSSGGTNALTASASVALASDVSGTLPVTNGGTGQTTLSSGALLRGNGTSGVSSLVGSANGHVATWNGSEWVSQAPASAGVTSFNSRTGAVTLSSGDVTGALGFTPANQSSLSSYALLSGATFTGNIVNSGGQITTTSGGFSGLFPNSVVIGNSNTGMSSNGSANIGWQIAGSAVMRVESNGNFFIGGSTAEKASGTTWANPSDIRLKDNIQNYTGGLSKLMQVQPKVWNYNGKGNTTAGTKGLGVIADEIEKVLPNTVDTYKAKLNKEDATETDIKRFDATEITWLLVNSVKELKAELDAAKAEIAALKAK
jgi:hypothetical protein